MKPLCIRLSKNDLKDTIEASAQKNEDEKMVKHTPIKRNYGLRDWDIYNYDYIASKKKKKNALNSQLETK